jgi:hypothetical protein
MAANDAYQLQGRNGLDKVEAGQTFSGRSVGFLVGEEGQMEFVALKVDGTDVTVQLASAKVGFFPGGTVTELVVTTGVALVYPLDNDYTITGP